MKGAMNSLKWLYTKTRKSIPIILVLIGFSSFYSWLTVQKALSSKEIIDAATISDSQSLKNSILLLGIILIVQITFNGIQGILVTYSKESLKNKLQEDIYSHIIYSKWLSLNKFHSVDLLTRFSTDIDVITNSVIMIIPQVIAFIVLFFTSFLALLSLSSTMAILSLTIFPVILILSKFYGRKQKQYYLKIQEFQSKYNSFIQETFNNILIIKTFQLEILKKEKLVEKQKEKLALEIKKSYLGAFSNALLASASMIGYFLVFLWGSYNLSSGVIAFGSLTAMIQLFNNIQSPIYGLASAFPQLISTLGSIERIKQIEMLEQEDLSIKKFNFNLNNKDLTSTNLIQINNVSFSYDKKINVLSNISLSIYKEDIIGILGESGSGKTTLIRLLLSLIQADSGEIIIDNEKISTKHRDLFSYVPQGNTLFSGSIYENLIFDNSQVTDDDINTALKLTCCKTFINNLPNGINTIIGEKGTGLSEGQAQRITIARAILRKKPILILDEATSALDTTTELNILNSIQNIPHRPTCIIVTHRLSALDICNKILKL